jgi:hypothetical protein
MGSAKNNNDLAELHNLKESVTQALNHMNANPSTFSDTSKKQMVTLLSTVKEAESFAEAKGTNKTMEKTTYQEKDLQKTIDKALQGTVITNSQEKIDKAAKKENPGLFDHFNQYRYEQINGERKDSIRMSRNPLTLLGRGINATLNGIGALIHTVTDKIAEGLKSLASKIDEKFAQASESGSTLNRIGWGVAKLFIGTPLKVAASGIEGVGAVAHGACAMAGGLVRATVGMEPREGFRQAAKAGSRMLIDTMQTGINVTQDIGKGIKETGTGLKIPVVSQGMELVGGLINAPARIADVALQGTRAHINGQGQEFRAELGNAMKEKLSATGSVIANGALFLCAKTHFSKYYIPLEHAKHNKEFCAKKIAELDQKIRELGADKDDLKQNLKEHHDHYAERMKGHEKTIGDLDPQYKDDMAQAAEKASLAKQKMSDASAKLNTPHKGLENEMNVSKHSDAALTSAKQETNKIHKSERRNSPNKEVSVERKAAGMGLQDRAYDAVREVGQSISGSPSSGDQSKANAIPKAQSVSTRA